MRNLEALTFVVRKMVGAGRRGALALRNERLLAPAKIPQYHPGAKSSRDTQT